MAALIGFVLSNFTLTFFVIGLIAAAIGYGRKRRPRGRDDLVEAVFAWFLFFSIGVSFFYNFVMHVFFGKMAASFIGWADSPFQAEVGYASLGFAVIGFLAFGGNRGLRIAGVIGPACFLLGAAVGHVIGIVKEHNFAPGNAGVMLWSDILLPVLGLVLLWLSRESAKGR
ncbi:DUF6790 family protein [Martelella radicis]|uniref:DUF4345 domain-containing protein n=1 Tax=Martelella radicis TaxID=1397476 RepID=A0A7W6KI40_9HYPH|nr:DUF6790 family protein [Martelella radicis]MBB4121532.1 hypothetical protein [Martelella radicis]